MSFGKVRLKIESQLILWTWKNQGNKINLGEKNEESQSFKSSRGFYPIVIIAFSDANTIYYSYFNFKDVSKSVWEYQYYELKTITGRTFGEPNLKIDALDIVYNTERQHYHFDYRFFDTLDPKEIAASRLSLEFLILHANNLLSVT